MKFPVTKHAGAAVLAGLLGLLAFGCSKSTVHVLVPNQRPVVTITSAPASSSDTSFYAYNITWAGFDPDGQVDHYTYAVDPTDTDTLWQSTSKKGDTFFFRARNPVVGGPASQAPIAVSSHIFVIKAWDNLGMASVPTFRAFTSYTVCPTVTISDPQPIPSILEMVTPSTRISWSGSDPDGQFTQKPIKYKYKLLARGNSEFDFDLARVKPDSVRRFYAKTNFAGWDSIGGDTTTVQYTGLLPNQQYIFIIIAIDEAGAYSPIFSLAGNMLQFEVGFAGTLGPMITVWNESFLYTQDYGSWYPELQSTWFPIEVPAYTTMTFNWSAQAPSGSLISYYRWRIGGNLLDETPRTNEATDWAHWSAASLGTTSCTVGNFAPNVQQLLYVGAWDNNGLRSVVTLQIKPIQPTWAYPVLVVNDTRCEIDQVFPQNSATPGQFMGYSLPWPAYAELDTFLFARGNVPWRGTLVAPTDPNQPVSSPGVFAGYKYDTLGTRLGLAVASAGVPFSKLSQYQHVIWLDDYNSYANGGEPTDASRPISTLHWMSHTGRQNTLGAYVNSGGSVWLAGGGLARSSLIDFNATGSKSNDDKYGAGKVVFSFDGGELIPGRLMYDTPHWQTEMVCQLGRLAATTVYRSPNVPKPWLMHGFKGKVYTSPTYTDLPVKLRPYSAALGDLTPPTRPDDNAYYTNVTYDLEYMTKANYIQENISSNQGIDSTVSVLDTLMSVRGASLAFNALPGQTTTEMVVMSWYHGIQRPDCVFSGFPIWMWTRADCVSLVDFVMRDLWGQARSSVPNRAASNLRTFHSGPPATPSAAPSRVGARMPVNRAIPGRR